MPDDLDAALPEQETDEAPKVGLHEAPDGAPVHPLIDLSRDPTPGEPDHARPEE